MNTMTAANGRPTDDYDIAAWEAYYAANPGLRRSVGAAGDDENEEDNQTDDQNTDDTTEDGNDEDAGADDDSADEDNKDADKDVDKDDGPSDREAQLLKESMTRKKKLKAQDKELAKLKEKLAKFDGIDPDEVAKQKANERKHEEEHLAKKGEFDVLKKRMAEEHDKAIEEKDAELEDLRAKLKKSGAQIDDLTIGHAFDNDPYIKDKLVLSPAKARVVYGSHFEINDDGQLAGYTKPVGANGAEPFVDAGGDPLAFTEVIQKLVEADSDSESMMRSTMRPGGDSKSAPSDAKPETDKPELHGADKIAAALNKSKAA